MSRRTFVVAGAALLGIGLVSGGAYWVLGGKGPGLRPAAAAQPDAQPQAPAVAVKVVRPQPRGIERTLTRPGSVHSFEYANLFGKVSGYLQHQTVDIGSPIHEGEVLAEVFAPELHANVKKGEADVQKAKANVEQQQARVEGAKADLTEAQAHAEEVAADLQSAAATRVLREKELARYTALAASNAVQKALVDEKQAARESAAAAEHAAEKAVTTAKAKVASATAGVQQAKADLAYAQALVGIAQAELANAQAFWEYTKIRAPFDGVVTKRNFHNGDFVRDPQHGGGMPLLTVNREDRMRVVVAVPDRVVPYTKPGVPATFTVDALPGRVFKGKVARIARSEEHATRTMRTEIDLPNPDGALSDGMYGSATLDLGREEGLTIPSAALEGDEDHGKRHVYVVRDGRAHRAMVAVVSDNGVQADVTSPDLKADDAVVVEHAPGLRDGVAVEATEARAAPAPAGKR